MIGLDMRDGRVWNSYRDESAYCPIAYQCELIRLLLHDRRSKKVFHPWSFVQSSISCIPMSTSESGMNREEAFAKALS